MGLTEDWADKMQGANFYSKNQRTTFEHYMQVRPAGLSVHVCTDCRAQISLYVCSQSASDMCNVCRWC